MAETQRTILFLAANPVNTMRDRLDEELRDIDEGLRITDDARRFLLQQVWAVRIKDLRRAMNKFRPAIVHFSGHAEHEGIYLEDESRQAYLVEGKKLRTFFCHFPTIECIVLNACLTEEQAAAISECVDYVIGMGAAVDPETAKDFAVAFYDTLGQGETYERSYGIAAASINLQNRLENARPVLKMRTDIDWVPIPKGKCLIGGDKAINTLATDDDLPWQTIRTPAFLISRYPITNEQYHRFVQAAGHRPPVHFTGGKPATGSEKHPVANVSWSDAQAYCAWLSEVGPRPVRLPTEVEWEKAARGVKGSLWPWGDQPAPGTERCNFDMAIGHTTPVGSYPAGSSPYGVMDMAGNVWEWTGTTWEPNPEEAPEEDTDVAEPVAYTRHVCRGGAFGSGMRSVRCASRAFEPSDSATPYIGFRIVCDEH